MIKNRTISLISHDKRKFDMFNWVKYNALILSKNKLICTGTTGKVVEKAMKEFSKESGIDLEINIEKKNSGPLGGDAQIASMVVEGNIDFCVFLIDDLHANPHEADIQMLLRQCRVHNIPVACNRYTADLIMTSDLWECNYTPEEPTYVEYKR